MTSAVPLISSQPLPEAVGVPVHNLDAVLLGKLEVHGVALGGADLRLADLDLNICTVYTHCTQNRFAKPLTSSSTSSTSGTMMHFSVVMSSQLTLTTSRGLSSHTFTRITVQLYTDCTLTEHKTGLAHLLSLGHSVGHRLDLLHQLGRVVASLLLHVLALHLIITVA